jgi:hypothetical protein
MIGIEPSKTQWDFISMTGTDCYYGVTMVDPTALCCFRGTSTLPDLLRALESTARVPPPSKQFNTAALGPVHPGAWQGLEEALASVVKDHHWSDIQIHRAQPGRHARHARDRRFCGHLCDRDGSAADRFWRMQVRLYQERAVCRHPRQRVFPGY